MHEQIVTTLTSTGPLPLWRLRELLHMEERPLYRQVSRLRNSGALKRIGQNDRRVLWAIASWDGPLPDARRDHATTRPPRIRATRAASPPPPPPTPPWWVEAQHTNFYAAAHQRAREMGWDA